MDLLSKINFISFADLVERQRPDYGGKIAFAPFCFRGADLAGCHAKWGMTTGAAGSMRFRWNEENKNRGFLEGIFGEGRICPIELVHSKTVFEIEKFGDAAGFQGDGIITKNKSLVPTVTVADCVPIFLYDAENGFRGIVHSGWKGTGIVLNAIEMMSERFGSKIENLCVAIGPHIESCYFVDEERANYFVENFGSDCVEKAENEKNPNLNYKLSLLKANLLALDKIGFPKENIVAATDCTYSAKNGAGDFIFGSCRRETENLEGERPSNEFSKLFTVQAAFVRG